MSTEFSKEWGLLIFCYTYLVLIIHIPHCSRLKIVYNEIVTIFHSYKHLSKLAKWPNSVGVQILRVKLGQNQVKIGKCWCFLPIFNLFLALWSWTSTEFSHMTNFDNTYVHMNVKYWNWGVTISLRTFYDFEQCDSVDNQ